MTELERAAAIANYIPKKPIKHELGGGIYYTCYWASCGEDIKRWNNYCPKCGQKIDWSDDE